MALIKTQTMENATGSVKEIYDNVLKKMPFIPKPLQLTSASPELLKQRMAGMGYFMNHPTLSPALLGHIRMLIAFHSDYPYCIELNGQILQMAAGMSDEEVAAVRNDPSRAKLEAKDKTMLQFVLKAVLQPDDTTESDITQLHDLGWTDVDIFDATFHGVSMISAGILFNAFKMNED